jgi:dihydroorotate dehydrogenase electron transfer subunit
MQMDTGKISLIQIEPDGNRIAQIRCSPRLLPPPGGYVLAHNPDEPDTPLGHVLFQVGLPGDMGDASGFDTFSLGSIPKSWHPGTSLVLRGPLGKGFQLPPALRCLALIALGETAERLLPLIPIALEMKADIAIFSNTLLPPLPPIIEIRSLHAVPEAIEWADFVAIDLPLENIALLRNDFHLDQPAYLPCPAQVLVSTAMPCAGVAECGVCALPRRKKGYAFACKDGPVFNLNELRW